MKFEKYDKMLMGYGCGFMLLGLVISQVNLFVGGGLVLFGIMFSASVVYDVSRNKKRFIKNDERSTGINEKASYFAFWSVICIIGILYIADVIWQLDLEFSEVARFVMLFGMAIVLLSREYYNKKGDSS